MFIFQYPNTKMSLIFRHKPLQPYSHLWAWNTCWALQTLETDINVESEHCHNLTTTGSLPCVIPDSKLFYHQIVLPVSVSAPSRDSEGYRSHYGYAGMWSGKDSSQPCSAVVICTLVRIRQQKQNPLYPVRLVGMWDKLLITTTAPVTCALSAMNLIIHMLIVQGRNQKALGH